MRSPLLFLILALTPRSILVFFYFKPLAFFWVYRCIFEDSAPPISSSWEVTLYSLYVCLLAQFPISNTPPPATHLRNQATDQSVLVLSDQTLPRLDLNCCQQIAQRYFKLALLHVCSKRFTIFVFRTTQEKQTKAAHCLGSRSRQED